jgi:hypothetical protein
MIFLLKNIYTHTTPFGEVKTIELKKDGMKIPLTNENRREYFDLMVQWYMEKSVEKQLRVSYITCYCTPSHYES